MVRVLTKLKKEIDELPKFKEISFKKHPMLGKKLLHEISFNNNSNISYDKVIVFSPTCDICHEEVKRLTRSSKQVLFVGNALDSELYSEFIQQFDNKDNFVALSDFEVFKKLNINFYPIFVTLDSTGRVSDLSSKSIF
ncbi:hypothetical protein [Halobacillus salinus]|uniref:hypothetical protein n=1 Tax=Halobacillus salinus TaxID=192814 RepID=UPI001591045F|nr:hypothetical protein [Halobacillus salinus]